MYSFTLRPSSPGQICGLAVASTSLDELSPNVIATTGCLYILIENDAGMAALARWSKRHLKKGRSEYVCVDMDHGQPFSTTARTPVILFSPHIVTLYQVPHAPRAAFDRHR